MTVGKKETKSSRKRDVDEEGKQQQEGKGTKVPIHKGRINEGVKLK